MSKNHTLWSNFLGIRKYLAWAIIPVFASLMIAHEILITKYPRTIGYSFAPEPPAWLLWWRNVSLFFVFLGSLLTLPRWQSFLGLLALGAFLYFALKF
jgi:hypothetical protein